MGDFFFTVFFGSDRFLKKKFRKKMRVFFLTGIFFTSEKIISEFTTENELN